MSILETYNLIKQFKQYDTVVTAVNRVNLKVEPGKFIAIIGSSGSGKSTLLRIMAGLDRADSGSITILGEDLTRMKPDALNAFRGQHLGFVFQNHNLIPGLTALENILVPTIMCNKISIRYEEHLKKLITALDIGDRLHHLPSELSGGQQQRVAIARALVKMPSVLLLDEPLSNLDARLRLQTREEIRRIQRETGITTVFVTHDQEEAMSISDLIVVMKLGVVQQIDKPQNVYDDPTNLFVAKFLGTPPINIFSGHVKNERLFIGENDVLGVPGVEDREVTVGIRPEGFVLDKDGPLECKLSSIEVMGRDINVVSTHDASLNPVIRSIINADVNISAEAEHVNYSLKPHKVFIFDKDTEERIRFEVKQNG